MRMNCFSQILIKGLLLLCCLSGGPAFSYHYLFINISENGKTDFPSRLNQIYEGNDGYLWMATDLGLGRYDGNELTFYTHDKHNPNSIPDNLVFSTAEDADGRIWICTEKGVAYYNYADDDFFPLLDKAGKAVQAYTAHGWEKGILFGDDKTITYYDPTTETLTEMGELPIAIRMDKMILLGNDTLLIQGHGGKIWSLPLRTGQKEIASNQPFSLAEFANDMLIDSEHRLWVATANEGVLCLAETGQLIKSYTTDNSPLRTNLILSLTESEGNILIGTKTEGLYRLDPKTQTFTQFKSKVGETPFAPPSNEINCLYTDRQNNVLMSAARHGLVTFEKSCMRFFTNSHSLLGKGPSTHIIPSILADGNKLWVGTKGGGLNLLDHATNTFKQIPTLKEEHINSMAHYATGKLLLSLVGKGLCLFDKQTNGFTPLRLIDQQTDSINFHPDKGVGLWRINANTILISGDRPYLYDIQQKRFCIAEADEPLRRNNDLLRMVCNDDSVSYLNNRSHLFRLDHRTWRLTTVYTASQEQPIYTATQTPDGRFWMGTNQGLICYDPTMRKDTLIETSLFHAALSVCSDPNGIVWIGSHFHLFAYKPDKDEFATYTQNDGVNTNEYIENSTALMENHLYMGGSKGLVQINYDEIFNIQDDLSFAIGGYKLNGESKGNPFYEGLNELEIPASSNISIQVMTKGRYRFHKRNYRFRVHGYNNVVRESSVAVLTLHQLASGTYTIDISATRFDGSWMPYQPLLKLKVLPPFFLRWWFLTIAFSSFIALFTLITFLIHRRKQQVLKQEMVDNKMRMNEEKASLLINICNELRTPFTLICSPLLRILQQTDPHSKHHMLLMLIYKHVLRMNNLIDMMLDLDRMNNKPIQLKMDTLPFNAWLEEVINGVALECEEQGINLLFTPDERIGQVDFNSQRIDIVVSNLLTYAIRFSPKGSTISVKSLLEEGSKQVRVSISDEGEELQPGDEKSLFSRFYQGFKERSGTGIGLAYDKIIIEQHHGIINAYNRPNKGVTIFFTLPIVQANAIVETEPSASELAEKSILYFNERQESIDKIIEEEEEELSQVVIDKTDYTVLVVDDQSSVTEIMQTTLAEHFKQVLTAKDGVEALKVLRSNRPDAVITDVKMPRMDGYELCRQIKQDITISHIPVVLMTDNTNRKRVMISYKTGADAYLPKPFDVELMMQVVINLINCRRQILNKLKAPGQATLPQEITISYADENFLTKINQLIEQHLDDTQLDIALLESEMCMSRTSLFNKMKALTNMGCNEYITKQRMEKAIRLVKESTLSFGEISEKVGYSTPSYFSAAFKQFTGMTPTQYRKEQNRSSKEEEAPVVGGGVDPLSKILLNHS